MQFIGEREALQRAVDKRISFYHPVRSCQRRSARISDLFMSCGQQESPVTPAAGADWYRNEKADRWGGPIGFPKEERVFLSVTHTISNNSATDCSIPLKLCC